MNNDVIDDIFDDLYSEATPSYEELKTRDTEYEEPLNYLMYLDGDRQLEIIEHHLEEHDIPNTNWRSYKFNVILGASPSSSLNNVNRARENEDLEPLDPGVDVETDGGEERMFP